MTIITTAIASISKPTAPVSEAAVARSGLTKAVIFVAPFPQSLLPCTLCWRSWAAEDKTVRTPECHRDPSVRATAGIEPSGDHAHCHDALHVRAIPLIYNVSLESERYEIVTDGIVRCSFLSVGGG
ncbi:MAG TPA: hypothetical protein VNO25_09550 [Streptosporangiaceae bacterium]|nr:hypothetical protein [Streptosporangiaceae bacterium]